ncbi:MAG: DUF3194 domain-containing protein [Candidatus Helarchaeota archaeon]|nr:DUF3194 domain-containing protein [Candidatus Helarchaeota archaeon]
MIIKIGIPALNEEEIIKISEIADFKIKEFIFSKVKKSKVTILESTIEINRENNICNIEIELDLEVPSLSTSEVEKLAENAINKAFKAIENEFKK